MGRRERNTYVEGEALSRRFVLDTSVVVKWFSGWNEEDAEKAAALRSAHMERTIVLMAPELLYWELANALRHHPRLTASEVRVALHSVFDMSLEIGTTDAELMETAISLAYTAGITVYDACFLALAKRFRAVCITADRTLYNKVKGFPCVKLLADCVIRSKLPPNP